MSTGINYLPFILRILLLYFLSLSLSHPFYDRILESPCNVIAD
jgi:hypothetical protein